MLHIAASLGEWGGLRGEGGEGLRREDKKEGNISRGNSVCGGGGGGGGGRYMIELAYYSLSLFGC